MQRDDALALACGAICLQIHSVLPLAMKSVSVSAVEPILPDDVVTWLAKNARFFTLVKAGRGTRVYDHADDLLYYASPHAELHPDCPEGHAFLCQAVCDRQPDGSSVPRLLVTDLVVPQIQCPKQRGEALRRLGHVLPPICSVQWAGSRSALQPFIAAGSVPHPVETLIALRAPLQLVRESGSGIAALDALDLPRI
jgi:hypothetical protein